MDQHAHQEKVASAVIAAYNEEATIGAVVDAIRTHRYVWEVIVVDDGSSDKTAAVARAHGAIVICQRNKGKAAAMDAGVKRASGNIIFFSDADIIGLTHETITQIIDPVLSGEYSMHVGVMSRDIMFFNRLFRYFPIISGQRAMRKDLWSHVPHQGKNGFKIEIALNFAAKQDGYSMGFDLVHGLSQNIKERKYGLTAGMNARIGMIYDVVDISARLYLAGYPRRKWRRIHSRWNALKAYVSA